MQDDGIGFQSWKKTVGGLGLVGMKERIQAIDGMLQIASQPDKGTTIRVEIPVVVTV